MGEPWPDGGLVVDKPAGWTSHDVCAWLRRLVGTRRVGHAGTLDPFATGVLVVCIGAATRLVRFLAGCGKSYHAVIRLGFATSTQDFTGERTTPIAASERIPDDAALIRRVLAEFTGEIEQVPPMFSAKKVGGRTLHKLARAGREVYRPPIRIHVETTLTGGPIRNDDGTVDLPVLVECSAGTYVRTLAHDIGERLGCGGHLTVLRRTRAGNFTVEQSSPLEFVDATRLLTPAELVGHLPHVVVDDEQAKLIRSGQRLSSVSPVVGIPPNGGLATEGEAGGEMAVLTSDGHLVAVAVYDPEQAALQPRIVLPNPRLPA